MFNILFGVCGKFDNVIEVHKAGILLVLSQDEVESSLQQRGALVSQERTLSS